MGDLAAIREAAALVEVDLRTTLGSSWSCRAGDDLTITISDGHVSETSLLDPAEWCEMNGTPHDEAHRAVDAFDAVTAEATELLRVLGREWPVCQAHDVVLDACEGTWLCPAGAGHDVAFVGELASSK